MYRYFKKIRNTDYKSAWNSNILSDENIKPPSTSINHLTPSLSYICPKTRVKFSASSLKQIKLHLFMEKQFFLEERGFGKNLIIFGADICKFILTF